MRDRTTLKFIEEKKNVKWITSNKNKKKQNENFSSAVKSVTQMNFKREEN